MTTEYTYPSPEDRAAFHAYYHEQGYIVARQMFDPSHCDRLKEIFLRDVRPFEGPILRQTTTRPERHNVSADGFMTNPILNIQDLDEPHFQEFRQATYAVLTTPALEQALTNLMGEEPVLAQSMYFEGGRGTDPHTDSHFMDSAQIGRMVGIWVALEDIAEEASRFFIYPKSHLLGDPSAFDQAIAADFATYQQMATAMVAGYQSAEKKMNPSLNDVRQTQRTMRRLMKTAELEQRVPPMQRGDVIFWAALTFHGSTVPTAPGFSRHSITSHFVPASAGLVHHHRDPQELALETVNGLLVHHPKQSPVQRSHS